LAGTPRAIAADQFDRGRSQWFQRADVFGRNADGRLLHYWWTPYDGWLVENLTRGGGPPGSVGAELIEQNFSFAGDPVVVIRGSVDSAPRHEVFGRNRYNQLIHYWWTIRDGWHMTNLTSAVVGGQGIAGEPQVVHGPNRLDVFGRNTSGELVHYWRFDPAPYVWHCENLTRGTSRPLFDGDPVAVGSWQSSSSQLRDSFRHDIYGRNSSGQLIHYWWSSRPPNGWAAESITSRIAGPGISGRPVVTVHSDFYGWPAYVHHNVYALAGNGFQLVHYRWSDQPPSGWHAANLTGPTGLVIKTEPVALTASMHFVSEISDSRVRYDVFARNFTDELITYQGGSGRGPHEPGYLFGWTSANLTTGTSPLLRSKLAVAMKSWSESGRWWRIHPRHDVFARGSSGRLIRYWRTDSSGWHAEDLTTAFAGPTIAGDPAIMSGGSYHVAQ
jgi:hypothetical protein